MLGDSLEIQGRMRERRAELDRFADYVVIEKIASGGMAEIYKVRPKDRPTQYFALKTIRPDLDEDLEFRRMLADEAKIASTLVHPNINRVIGIARDAGQVGLILEFVDGLDVGRMQRHLKDRGTPLSFEAVIHVVREVLEGLDYAHNAKDERGDYLNVVHRDVSPGNVMVDVKGQVRIVDFGIARAQNRMAKTEAGNVKGKFRYMAPEQIRGDLTGPGTDIYATAIFLWELLAGRRIYDEVGVAQLMIRVANAHVPSLDEARPNLPRALQKVFQRATALEPQDRFLSARAFADALDSVLLEFDPKRCRRELAEIVSAAHGSDTKARFKRAVARARFAAEHDLEDAILSALESPDRVERVDTSDVVHAEPLTPVSPLVTSVDPSEPPTMPMQVPAEVWRGSTPPVP